MLRLLRSPFPFLAKTATALTVLSRPANAQISEPRMGLSFLPEPVAEWLETFRVLPWSAGCLAVIAIVLLVGHRMRLRRRAIRTEILGLPNGGPRFRVVDAMVHAVWMGRKINEDRLKRALEVARDTTNMDYTLDHMREAAMRADRIIIPLNFHWMRDGLSRDEKMVIFNATVSVLLADGPMTRSDRAFLRTLTNGLGLHWSDLRHLARLVAV